MAKRDQKSYEVVSIKTLEHVIQEIFRFAEGQCMIAFQGGEPTLAGLDFYRACIRLEKSIIREM